MSSVDAILDTTALATWIGLQTVASKACLADQLKEWSDNPQYLLAQSAKFKRFKDAFKHSPEFYQEAKKHFTTIADIEKKLDHLMNGQSDLEKESYNEILFFKPLLQPLNFIPFLLPLWAMIRVYILPGMSLLFPIIMLIAPYLILKVLFHLPITFSNYTNILHAMVTGNVKRIFTPQAPEHTENTLEISPFKFLKQFGIVIATCIQGFIQPYWTHQHLKSIDTIVVEHGTLVIQLRDTYQALQRLLTTHGFTMFKCPLPEMTQERDATARIILDSTYFKLALKYIGSLEVIMTLASKGEVNPVRWVSSKTPVFRISDTFDFQVPIAARKTISVSFQSRRHALLTGPNKGGKSTVLRALSSSALLAHTYGCTFGQATMTPFHKLFVCLKPDDLPGSKSRFEREIEFTASTLMHTRPIMILIDELYHSTNPPDALRSCHVYADRLWRKQNTISVVSTHLFEWVTSAPRTIQRLCCPAVQTPNGGIEFEYTLKRGICKVSSVDMLLRENGLLDKSFTR
jgi:hypothetical protein